MIVVFVSLGGTPGFVSTAGGAAAVGDPVELEWEDTLSSTATRANSFAVCGPGTKGEENWSEMVEIPGARS